MLYAVVKSMVRDTVHAGNGDREVVRDEFGDLLNSGLVLNRCWSGEIVERGEVWWGKGCGDEGSFRDRR